ncbi:MAG: ArnT family glycosyltransferase [Desulfocucumaceae bacterium]
MKRDHLITLLCLFFSVLFSAFVWYLHYKSYFTGLILNDAMDYAGIARNVARGQGFISQYITPLSLAHHGVPQPDMWRAPLWPLALAAFQKVFGFIDEASALGSGFFFIITGPVIFLLARQWFDNIVAAGSVLLYALTPKLLYYSLSGMTESMSIFLMSLAILLASVGNLKNKPGDWLSGAGLGLFYLARYNALVFLPFFLLYRWYYRKEGLLPPVRLLAGFTLTALPWFVRNTVIFGSPLFSLQKYEPVMFTPLYPDYSLYLYTIQVNVMDFIKNNPWAMAEKLSENWSQFMSSFFSPDMNGISAFIFILFIVAAIIPLNKKAAGIRPLLLACFFTQLAALLIIHFIPRLFLIFSPFYIVFALGAIKTLLEVFIKRPALRALPGMITAVAVLFLAYNNYTGPGPLQKITPDRIPYSNILGELPSLVPKDKVILSDMGHQVSWYGDRYACKIPYSVEMIPEIQKRADIGGVFISDRILWHMPEADRSWKFFWYQHPKEIYGLRLTKLIENKGLIYLPSVPRNVP